MSKPRCVSEPPTLAVPAVARTTTSAATSTAMPEMRTDEGSETRNVSGPVMSYSGKGGTVTSTSVASAETVSAPGGVTRSVRAAGAVIM